MYLFCTVLGCASRPRFPLKLEENDGFYFRTRRSSDDSSRRCKRVHATLFLRTTLKIFLQDRYEVRTKIRVSQKKNNREAYLLVRAIHFRDFRGYFRVGVLRPIALFRDVMENRAKVTARFKTVPRTTQSVKSELRVTFAIYPRTLHFVRITENSRHPSIKRCDIGEKLIPKIDSTKRIYRCIS